MANKTLQDVRDAIKTKLETLKWTNKVFVNVYDYFTTKPNWFPFVQFEPADLTAQYEDTDNNYRSFGFKIVIVQEMTNATRDTALDIVCKAFDLVINAFDSDWTLAGTVQMVNATQGAFWEIVLETWPCLFATINVVAKILYKLT